MHLGWGVLRVILLVIQYMKMVTMYLLKHGTRLRRTAGRARAERSCRSGCTRRTARELSGLSQYVTAAPAAPRSRLCRTWRSSWQASQKDRPARGRPRVCPAATQTA